MSEPRETIIYIGRTVTCDVCNEDWTDRPESGGFLFDSYAYCPDCAVIQLPTIQRYHEESHIKARCPSDQSFADWCRCLRNGEHTIKFKSL